MNTFYIKILKPCTLVENGIKINSQNSDRLPFRKTVDDLMKFFKKNHIEIMCFHIQKDKKYFKFKNDPERLLRAFIKEL